jgi:hypothetical protein
MHCLFLLQLPLLAQAATSSLISDLWTRDPGMATYNVYPKEPIDATSFAKTETILRSEYGDRVHHLREGELADLWIITSKRG